jgi:hypothetical protein
VSDSRGTLKHQLGFIDFPMLRDDIYVFCSSFEVRVIMALKIKFETKIPGSNYSNKNNIRFSRFGTIIGVRLTHFQPVTVTTYIIHLSHGGIIIALKKSSDSKEHPWMMTTLSSGHS